MTAAKNVLIVDDEAMLRESVSAFLKTKGYGVYEAENGKDALDILSRRPVALVLLDLMLPGLPGRRCAGPSGASPGCPSSCSPPKLLSRICSTAL